MQKLTGTSNFIALIFVGLTNSTQTQPETATATAAWLNTLYMGFDENIDDSPLGVPISMTHQPRFQDNLFCSTLMNTTCFRGRSDCRTSTALYNHKMLLQSNTGLNATLNRPNMFNLTHGLPVGFVINPTRVQTDLGKCSYTYDGFTWYRLNGGCGASRRFHGRDYMNCSSQYTAFNNICPSTNKTCAADDVEIKGAACVPGTSGNVSSRGFSECFWGMPSLNYPEKLGPNHLRQMVKARLKADRESLHPVTATSRDNEVVIDDRLLIPAIRSDPAAVVLAFVYVKSSNGSRSIAEGMRDRFSEDYSVGKIPVIGLDDTVDFTPKNGPFIVEENGGLAVTMV